MSDLQEIEKLIFIGGCPRSGTTLVQNMLDSHPDVFGGPEFLHLQDIIELRRKLRWSISVGWIDTYCSHQELDRHLRTLVRSLFTPLANIRECRFFSEKSPMNVLVLSELIDLLPEAHFIHVVRDPRAIVSSMQDVRNRAKEKMITVPEYTRSISSCISFTSKCIASGFSALKKTPEKIHTVTYEALVAHPEEESRKICDFLGLEWSEHMLSPHTKKHLGEKAITSNSGEIWYDLNSYYQKPHGQNIEKWKQRLSPVQQVKVAQAFKGNRDLEQLGYDISCHHISWTRRIPIQACLVLVDLARRAGKLPLRLPKKAVG